MDKWMKMLEQWMGGGAGGAKRVQTLRWLCIVGLVGVAMMIINSFVTVKEIETTAEDRASPHPQEEQAFTAANNQESIFQQYEHKYESRIREILQKIVGVGEVEVMITIESTEEIVVEHNVNSTQKVTNEKDQKGSNRHITEMSRNAEVVLHQTSEQQSPIVVKTIKPKIRGVVVVARGAENVTVKKMIIEAVGRGLDVPPHRISIVPRKQ